jgi:hypothetical protein
MNSDTASVLLFFGPAAVDQRQPDRFRPAGEDASDRIYLAPTWDNSDAWVSTLRLGPRRCARHRWA